MDQAAIDHIEQQIDGEAKKRFPGAVRRVAPAAPLRAPQLSAP